MVGILAWMAGIGVSVALLVLMAARNLYWAHMAVAAVISVAIAILAFQQQRVGTASPGGVSRSAAIHIRHMGLVFLWAAIAVGITYGTGILTWREWWQFELAFLVLTGLCLFVSTGLARDADAGRDDGTMLGLARILTLLLLVAMPLVMAGLALHDGRSFKLGGKMLNFFTAAGQRPNWQDWGANNVFFFGALAVAALAWTAFSTLRSAASK